MLELKSTLCNVIRNFELIPSKVQLQVIAQLTLKSLSGVHVGFKTRKWITKKLEIEQFFL